MHYKWTKRWCWWRQHWVLEVKGRSHAWICWDGHYLLLLRYCFLGFSFSTEEGEFEARPQLWFFCFFSSSGFASLVRSLHDHAATRRGFDLLWVISIPFPSALKWISEGIFICLSRSLCAAWILARWCKHRRPNISLCTTQGLCLISWYYISERRSFWLILCLRLFWPML